MVKSLPTPVPGVSGGPDLCSLLLSDDMVDYCLTLSLENYPSKQRHARKKTSSLRKNTKMFTFGCNTEISTFTITVQNQTALSS